MGGVASVAQDDKIIARWKQINNMKDVKEKFISEGTFACTENELELRALLEDEVAFVHLRRYAIRHGNKTILLCWRILEEYNMLLQRGEGSLEKLLNISNLCFSATENEDYLAHFDQYRGRIEYLISNPTKFKKDEDVLIYNCLHMICFDCILTTIYHPFKTKSPYEYSSMCAAIRANYNQVSPTDFEYSGIVNVAKTTVTLRCRKKRTGTKFVMKVQLKSGLLAHNRSNPADVIMDMSANSISRHPYLSSLVYAFQTATLAIMVFPTSVSTTINSMLHNSPQNRFTISRVQFYAAELVSALCFLHENEVIYHHLNIYTVSVTSAGHILLADFGSTVSRAAKKDSHRGAIRSSLSSFHSNSSEQSVNATNFGSRSKSNDENDIFGGIDYDLTPDVVVAPLDDMVDEEGECEELDENAEDKEEDEDGGTSRITLQSRIDFLVRKMKRGKGGRGADYIPYVAPEVSMLLACPDTVKDEDYFYSDAIDWWCLGILLYRMLVGKYPFKVLSMQQIQSILPETVKKCDGDIGFAFASVFGEVDYQSYSELLTADAIDLVSGLLEVNIVERLGVTTMTRDDCAAEEGISAHSLLKKHNFFENIDIDLVENNELLPPYSFDDDGIRNIPASRGNSFISTPIIASNINSRPSSAGSVMSDVGSSMAPELNRVKWCGFDEIMKSCDKQSWLSETSTFRNKNGNEEKPQPINDENVADMNEHESIEKLKSSELENHNISKKDQLYFMDWNYVSQAVIQQEGDIFKGKPGAFITKVFGWKKNKKGFMK